MKRTVLIAATLVLLIAGGAEAGRETRCVDIATSFVEIGTDRIAVDLNGIDVLGAQYDAELGLTSAAPLMLRLEGAGLTQNPGMPGGFFDQANNNVHVYCLSLDHTMYWVDLPIQSVNSHLDFGVAGLDFVRDLSNTVWILPLATGSSELGIGRNGTALLDGFPGQWRQKGNDLFVDILDGTSYGMFTVGPGSMSGTVSHFGQTTNVQGLHPNGTTLSLNNGRFRVKASWQTPGGSMPSDPKDGYAIGNGDESGLFWFFDSGNTEMLVKVLDGCNINNHYWVFYGATTNVEYTLTVTDNQSDQVKTFDGNPLGQVSGPILDTSAFATCP